MDTKDSPGKVISHNGEGNWTIEAVQKRYRIYCSALHIEMPRQLVPHEHKIGNVKWIYPIMEEVIRGIEDNDAACIALGIDFVEEDARFPFGKILKSNTARALRRSRLTESQKERLRERISTMLVSGVIPHEMREYVKLLKAIGVGKQWVRIEQEIPRDNPYAMRFYKSLRQRKDSQPDSLAQSSANSDNLVS